MELWLMVSGGGAFLLLAFTLVGGPIFLVDWFRERRQAAIDRQIALTEALDGQLGAIVSPVVTRSFLGRWQVQIAVPLLRLTMVARILSVVDDVFSDVPKMDANSYRIVLNAKPGFLREAPRSPGTMRRWVRNSVAAA